MGICSSKKNDKEDGIKLQIAQTIVEQQKLKEQEELENQNQGNDSDCYSKKSLGQQFTTLNTHHAQKQEEENQNEAEQEQMKTKKKTKQSKVDTNYFRKQDHIIKISSLIVELLKEDKQQYYLITIGVNLKDKIYNCSLHGILITQNDHQLFTLSPDTFKEANKFARFQSFFSNDSYFNIDKENTNNFTGFEKLLNVKRGAIQKDDIPKLQKKKSFTPEKENKKQEFITSINYEMLEVINIVDVELQQRFLCILFHLVLQQNNPMLETELVFIKNTTFLFDQPPQFDQPNVYRLAIFYDQLEYSLKDFYQILQNENKELSLMLHKKLSLNLITIFYKCYSNYLYRLNLTMTSIFYVPKYKNFKLECFGRIKSIVPFGQGKEQFDKLEEKKIHLFYRDFKKDMYAICDLILCFKNVQKLSLRHVQSLRKKFYSKNKKNDEDFEQENKYRILIQSLFNNEGDANIMEFFNYAMATAINGFNQDVNQFLNNIEGVIQGLQKKISDYEQRLDMPKHDESEIQSLEENEEEDNLNSQNFIDSFPADFETNYKKIALNPDKMNESDYIYKEIIYQSLLYLDNFPIYFDKYLQCEKQVLQDTYVIILNAFYTIKQNNDDSWSSKLEQISSLIEKGIDKMKNIYEDSIDNFHITILFQLMTLSKRKPLPILNQLQRCITKQLQQKMQSERKLRSQNSATGLLEQKKHVMLQVWYSLSYLKVNQFFMSISKIQKIIGFQLKNHHTASLSYGYSLLVSGEISKLSLQPITAMLNLEMSLGIYNSFFPEFKYIEENEQQKEIKVNNLATSNKSKVEFLLGMSYFESHDQENAMQCLKRASQLMLRSFNMFADEVVFLVLSQLQIHIMQEDIGQAMKISLQYANEMNNYYRQGKQFKRKIIAKLQFIIGNIFEFNGQYLSAIRFIERSNRTLSNARANNFVIQMHYQSKKMQIIQKMKEAFYKIKNKIQLKKEQDLALFQTLYEAMGASFQSLFYKQPITYKTSVLFYKYGKLLMKIQGLERTKQEKKAQKALQEIMKTLNKAKKDEIYAILEDKYIHQCLDQWKFNEQIEQLEYMVEIHDRYLQFPQKQIRIIKALLTGLFLILQRGNSKMIFEHFKKIENIIDEFNEILQWENNKSKSNDVQIQNKFETLAKRGKISMIYSILYIVYTIDYFIKLKKKIFEKLQNPQQLSELGNQSFHNFESTISNSIIEIIQNKQNCLLGYKSEVKIYQKLIKDKSIHEKPLIQTKNKVSYEESTQIEPLDKSKIVFDLRSIEEIMESKRHDFQHKQQKSAQMQSIIEQNEMQSAMKTHKRTITEVSKTKSKKKKSQSKLDPFQSTLKKSTK